MKTFIKACVCFSVFILTNNYAQESDFSLEDIKAPSMPSATIIGTQVSDINTPKSMKELETAIFTNYLNSGQSLTVPNNYALEINPFMLSGMKNFNYNNYLKNSPGDNIWHNLSISIASTNKFLIKDSVNTNAVGFGIRTTIFNGEPTKKVSEAFTLALKQNEAMLELNVVVRALIKRCLKDTTQEYSVESLGSCVIQQFKKENLTDDNGNPLNGEELAKKQKLIAPQITVIKSIFEKIDKETPKDKITDEFDSTYKQGVSSPVLKNLKDELAGVKTNRYGLKWDINWALALNFPTNSFKYSLVPRWGAWTNVSYRSEDMESFTLIALGRFIINNDNYINNYQPVEGDFTTGNIYDLGLKLDYEVNRFSLNLQYIYRLNTNKITKIIGGDEYERTVKSDSRKYIFNINYLMTDDIILSYNIGKDFNEISRSNGDLISGLSINFGFGNINASELVRPK